jgi:hypothetical protein
VNAFPTPIVANIVRKPDQPLAIVEMVLDDSAAATCQRCRICRATRSPGLQDDQVTCVSHVPAAQIDDFLLGPPADAPVPDAGAAKRPRKAAKGKGRRPRVSPSVLAAASKDALDAWTAQMSADDGVLNAMERLNGNDSEWEEIVGRERDSLGRLAKLGARAFGRLRDDQEPAALDVGDAILLSIPIDLIEAAGNVESRRMIIPVRKVAVRVVAKSE